MDYASKNAAERKMFSAKNAAERKMFLVKNAAERKMFSVKNAAERKMFSIKNAAERKGAKTLSLCFIVVCCMKKCAVVAENKDLLFHET